MFFFLPIATDRTTKRRPYVTYTLMGMNALVFIWVSLGDSSAIFQRFGFTPGGTQWFTPFTSMFIHAGILHLAGNMLFLWLFGCLIEDALGPAVLLIFYLGSQLGASILHLEMARLFTPDQLKMPVVGASGAIAGILGLAALRFYRTKVRVWYVAWYVLLRTGVAAVSAWIFLSLWVGSEVTSGVLSLLRHQSGVAESSLVANWAHIGGFTFGALGALLLNLKQHGKREYLVTSATTGSQAPLGDAGELVLLARSSPEDGHLQHALAHQRERAGLRPQAVEAYERSVAAFLLQGERQDATSAYDDLVALSQGQGLSAEVHFDLACALADQAQPGKALKAFARVASLWPGTKEAELSLLRAAQLCQGPLRDPPGAIGFYSRLLAEYPYTEWRSFAERRVAQIQT